MLLAKIRRANKYLRMVGLDNDLEQPSDWTGNEEYSTAASAARLINSEQRVTQLYDSWKAIGTTMDMNRAMQQVFESLMEERDDAAIFFKRIAVPRFMNSSSSKSFEIASTKEHGVYLAKILSNVMEELGCKEPTSPTQLNQSDGEKPTKRKYPPDIGVFHRHLKAYAFKVDLWDSVGVTMLQMLSKWPAVQSTGTLRGWTILVACMIDDMRECFVDQRQFNRSSIRRCSSRVEANELRHSLPTSPNVNDSRANVNTPAAVAFGRWQRKCSSMRLAKVRRLPSNEFDE